MGLPYPRTTETTCAANMCENFDKRTRESVFCMAIVKSDSHLLLRRQPNISVLRMIRRSLLLVVVLSFVFAKTERTPTYMTFNVFVLTDGLATRD